MQKEDVMDGDEREVPMYRSPETALPMVEKGGEGQLYMCLASLVLAVEQTRDSLHPSQVERVKVVTN